MLITPWESQQSVPFLMHGMEEDFNQEGSDKYLKPINQEKRSNSHQNIKGNRSFFTPLRKRNLFKNFHYIKAFSETRNQLQSASKMINSRYEQSFINPQLQLRNQIMKKTLKQMQELNKGIIKLEEQPSKNLIQKFYNIFNKKREINIVPKKNNQDQTLFNFKQHFQKDKCKNLNSVIINEKANMQRKIQSRKISLKQKMETSSLSQIKRLQLSKLQPSLNKKSQRRIIKSSSENWQIKELKIHQIPIINISGIKKRRFKEKKAKD